ncbi:unnamed protein product [Schistosoma curassoni]|uniref:Uncharacterized protein n=1 Tax=Schistosoma curassoni TaxID=6186 RepID=A0A183K2F7_9TREM|nr:unnamed protein product [Schistosoma curassoni]
MFYPSQYALTNDLMKQTRVTLVMFQIQYVDYAASDSILQLIK